MCADTQLPYLQAPTIWLTSLLGGPKSSSPSFLSPDLLPFLGPSSGSHHHHCTCPQCANSVVTLDSSIFSLPGPNWALSIKIVLLKHLLRLFYLPIPTAFHQDCSRWSSNCSPASHLFCPSPSSPDDCQDDCSEM